MSQAKRTLKPPIKISILEREENEVSHCWKTGQLFSYILVVISGIATSLAIGSLLRAFQNECILYSNITVQSVVNQTISTRSTGSFGTAISYCNFCQFCPVASVIFAGILGTFFIMCSKGGSASNNLPQPWRIVPPAFVFNLAFVILSCVSVALTFGGFSSFCDSVTEGVGLNDSSCEALMNYKWKEYPNATNFYDDIVIAETGAAISLFGWVMGFVILMFRCITHADFQIVAKPIVPSSPTPSDVENSTTTTVTTVPLTPPDKTTSENQPLIILTPDSEVGSTRSKKSKKKSIKP